MWSLELLTSALGEPSSVWKHSRWTVGVPTPLLRRSSCLLVPVVVTAKQRFPQLWFLPTCSLLLPAGNVLFLFLFFSFLSVEACSAFGQDWVGSSQCPSVSFDKAPNVRLGTLYPALLTGHLVTATPMRAPGYQLAHNTCAYLKWNMKMYLVILKLSSSFSGWGSSGKWHVFACGSHPVLLGMILALAFLFAWLFTSPMSWNQDGRASRRLREFSF